MNKSFIRQLGKNICKVEDLYFIKVKYRGLSGYVDGFNNLVKDFSDAYTSHSRQDIEGEHQKFISKLYWWKCKDSFDNISKHVKVCKFTF